MTDEERALLQEASRRVVCAANRMPDGTMFIGARHWDDWMREQAERYRQANGIEETAFGLAEQGFIDQYHNFLTREQAWKVARRQEQIIRMCGSDSLEDEEGMLFSEHLY